MSKLVIPGVIAQSGNGGGGGGGDVPSNVYTQDNLVAGTNISITENSTAYYNVSNFNTSNYIEIPQSKINWGNGTWSVIIKTKTPQAGLGNYGDVFIVGNSWTAAGLGASFDVSNDKGRFNMGLSSSGSSWNIGYFTPSTYDLDLNTDYWLKYGFDGTSTYKLQISTDGQNFNDYLTQTSTQKIHSYSYLRLGSHTSGTPYKGIIDVRGIKIVIGGVTTFDGATAIEGTDFNIVGNPTISQSDGSKYYQINNTQPSPDLSAYLQNTATGTDSLTILGTSTTQEEAINIGYQSQAKKSGVAVGRSASANAEISAAIGYFASASSVFSLAIGYAANVQSNCRKSIQLGSGVNCNPNTFQVYSYPMLDGNTGKIFPERLPSVNSIEVTDTMPTPSSSNVGQVKLYSGTTTSDFTNGYLYQCKLESTTSETVTFDSDKVTTTPEIFWLIVKLALPETYSNVTNGYITYNESANLVTFTFKDANNNVLGQFPGDVGELSGVGFTFNNLTDGEVINFTCFSGMVESYEWTPLIVQESSEIKIYNATSWSENTTLFPNRSLPLPNLDDLTDAGLYRVKFNCSMPNIELNLDYLCQVSVVNASGTILGHFQTLQVFYPGLNEDKGINVTLYRSKQTGSTWSDWKSSLVTSVSNNSTDVEYVSAKLFYDTCGNIEALINAL